MLSYFNTALYLLIYAKNKRSKRYHGKIFFKIIEIIIKPVPEVKEVDFPLAERNRLALQWTWEAGMRSHNLIRENGKGKPYC